MFTFIKIYFSITTPKQSMTKRIGKKSINIYIIAVLFIAITFLGGCAQSNAELSPMPAIDMSKNTIIADVSQEPQPESSFQVQSPIELTDPIDELINQGSNTENNGLASEGDGKIYFISDGLSSMAPSGNRRKQLTLQNDMLYLNVYGEFLYYVSSDDYNVYRLKKDPLDAPKRLNISGAYSMMIIGDHIYYQNAIGEKSDNYVYRTDMDGTGSENLMIKTSVFCSDGQTIYFANSEDENKLYSLSTCTGEIEQLSNNQVSQLNVIDGSLYYINKTTKHLTTLNIETLESTILSEENYSYLNNSGNLLVFYSTETGILGTMNLDGSEKNSILEYNDVNALNVANGWVFFESFENTFEEEVFIIRTDGTELSKELPVTSMAIVTNYDIDQKIISFDFVRYLSGTVALEEYMNDNSVSERKAQEIITEAGDIYIQNNNPKILEYSVSDMTDITLNISADSSYTSEGYKANIALFEEMYVKNPELISEQLYYVTAFEGHLIKIEQFFQP